MSLIREIINTEPTSLDAEHERRFIVDCTHEDSLLVATVRPRIIEQGYVKVDGRKYRVRSVTALGAAADNGVDPRAYELVTKTRQNARTRGEVRWRLTEAEFAEIWPETEGWRVSKTRHDVDSQGEWPAYERDSFSGPSGLVVAEVERGQASGLDDLVLPTYFGPEITGLKGWGSSGIARCPVTPGELATVMEIWHETGRVASRAAALAQIA